MLDAHFIRDNLDAVKANCKNRNVTADVDRVVTLDDERKRLVQKTQVMQQRQNEISKLIPQGKGPGQEAGAASHEGRTLREQVGRPGSAGQAGRGRPATGV